MSRKPAGDPGQTFIWAMYALYFLSRADRPCCEKHKMVHIHNAHVMVTNVILEVRASCNLRTG